MNFNITWYCYYMAEDYMITFDLYTTLDCDKTITFEKKRYPYTKFIFVNNCFNLNKIKLKWRY